MELNLGRCEEANAHIEYVLSHFQNTKEAHKASELQGKVRDCIHFQQEFNAASHHKKYFSPVFQWSHSYEAALQNIENLVNLCPYSNQYLEDRMNINKKLNRWYLFPSLYYY